MSGYCGRHRVGPGTHHPERHLPKSPQRKCKHCNTSTDYSHGTPPYTIEGSSTSPDPSVKTHIQSSMIATFGCTSHHFLIFKLFSQKNDLYFAETIAKLKKEKKCVVMIFLKHYPQKFPIFVKVFQIYTSVFMRFMPAYLRK